MEIIHAERPLAVPPEELQLSGEFREQADALLARVRLTREEVERLVGLYADVERALSPLWPRCRAVPFGSITTGLGTKGSDADCFVEVPGGAPGNAVNRARRPLQQMSQIFLDVIAIPRASTPIVKFLHVPTDTKCDLSFKTPLGVLNSRLLAHLLHRAPVLPRLAVLLKYWAGVHGLSGTGRLSNYSLVLLLFHYLQRHEPSILPPVEVLQRNPAFIFFVDNWNAGFDERAAPSTYLPHDDDLPELLSGFFEYYGSFEFNRYVISPYLGGPLLREMFSRPEALPDEFAIYRRNVLENVEPALRIETPWCIQDPFVHCHNVASGINTHFAADLIAYIRYAAAACVEERPNGFSGLLRRLLLERPQLARRATIALFNVHLKPHPLKAAGPDWRNRVRRATQDIFEGIFGATLHDRRYVEGNKGRESDECTARLERYLWRRRKQRRPRGAADMPFLEREIATSVALIAAGPIMPPISMQLTVKLGPTDKRTASVSVRLLEGDVVAFRDFGNYFMSVCQSWYAKLLDVKNETTDEHEIENEPDAKEAPLASASDNDASTTESEGSDAGSSSALSLRTAVTSKPPTPPPLEDTKEAHFSDSPTNPPLKILKMDDMNHVENEYALDN
ncbi:Terminal uridylyltransferase Tailor [Eumeta japonica]|uniref:Terminal uridylyltransferase Tailor n=1 Tax=Eumeta variegata TaxID=151549 RepID=A0A4C1XMQ2_EUMVA|nr:Terminal uridylyltransferase Tailor [Eumeta japonica]